MTVAKAVGRTQAEHEADHQKMRESLKKASEQNREEEKVKSREDKKKIKGYEMVEEKAQETHVTSSGSSWIVMAIVGLVLGLMVFGWKRRRI